MTILLRAGRVLVGPRRLIRVQPYRDSRGFSWAGPAVLSRGVKPTEDTVTCKAAGGESANKASSCFKQYLFAKEVRQASSSEINRADIYLRKGAIRSYPLPSSKQSSPTLTATDSPSPRLRALHPAIHLLQQAHVPLKLLCFIWVISLREQT
jgi:hypothetical protein